MKLVDLTCQHCGAMLKVDVDKKQATCNHCGAAILIDDGVQHIQYDNAEEAGYSFEKGRQRAQLEAREEKSNGIEMRSQQKHVSNQPQKGKRGTCWKIILWVFFFPIMITIFLVKTDKLKLPVKIVLIALLWIFFIAVAASGDTNDETGIDTIPTVAKDDAENTDDEIEQPILDTEKSEEINAEESVSAAQIVKSEESEANIEEADIEEVDTEEEYIRDENLNGRGRSDSGRSEPQYRNVIGYVVVDEGNYEIEHTDDFENTDLWVIPTYEQDKQFWNETEVTIPHKTEVVVKEQILEHEKYGAYSGYLLVESLESGEQYYINVGNFTTKPYWTYADDLRKAALTGDFVAVYHQVSNYYPVNNGGDKAEIEDGKVVLVTGVAGLSRYVDPDETGIDAVVWQEWKKGYGDVTIHFNAEDLTIIY